MSHSVRDAQLDYYKLFLIFLVVFAHLIETATANGIVRATYNFIYFFHIPAFVFLAGMMTRQEKTNARALKFFILLIAFQLLYCALMTMKQHQEFSWLQPFWLLWFLLSLVFWNLLAPVFAKLKMPVLTAFILALGVGCFDAIGPALSLSRTFYFLPFFVAGLCHGKTLIAFVKSRPAYAWAGTGLFIAAFFLFFKTINPEFLFGSHSYAYFGLENLQGLALRAICLGLSGITVLSLIAFMPTKESRLQTLGAFTLPVYLFHGFVVIPSRPFVENLFANNLALGFAAMALGAAILVYIFSDAFFANMLNAADKLVAVVFKAQKS